jgi:hypothetical protein
MKVVLCEGDAAIVVRSTGEVVSVFSQDEPKGSAALAVLALSLAAANKDWMERAMVRASQIGKEK